ncbi:MAG: hypothetical protein IQL11_12870 [Bacteroidales bacterium]|nr:hypothetical protein [Bacteroidales bacterium]
MLELVGVTSVRPGPPGTQGKSNSANTDEPVAMCAPRRVFIEFAKSYLNRKP